VTPSFICTNCGIKVSAEEGEACPGCGQNQGGSANVTDDYSIKTPGAFGKGKSVYSKEDFADEWVEDHFRKCESIFDYKKTPAEQLSELSEVKDLTLAALSQAPDSESKHRLSAYLSELYRLTEDFKESFTFGVQGVESSGQFFRHQSFNAILQSLVTLERFSEYEEWAKKARNDGAPVVDFYDMNYFKKVGKIQEALAACDSYFHGDASALQYNRGFIYLEANLLADAEQAFNKIIAQGVKNPHYAAAVNSLAFSVLMPQGRYVEAEDVLHRAICTQDPREKINCYSNLALVAFHFKEYAAAKRYASVGAESPDNAIASESRLTLCMIENQRLEESNDSTEAQWKALLTGIEASLAETDFDDAAKFLELFLNAGERANLGKALIENFESQYLALKSHEMWSKNDPVRVSIELMRVNKLSELYLAEKNYLALDELFIESLHIFTDKVVSGLLDYLRTPFAAIELRRAALKIVNYEFLAEWARFEEVAEILIGLSKHQIEMVLLPLAENPATPDAVCELISTQNDIDLDFALGTRVNLSEKMIGILSKSSFDSVRKEIAQRSDLSDDIYRTLAIDGALLVRDAIRENPACSPEIKALAALGSL
jgi:hypothetical protein